MDFQKKLPQNKKEFALFLAIISTISVNVIAPLITCFEAGFRVEVWRDVLQVLPFIWLTVVVLVLLTHAPADWMTGKIVRKEDSFGAQITISILCNVFLMSIILTVVGTWIGTRHISMEPITGFFFKWPRNFAISFFVEACLAQPIARIAMCKLHKQQASALGN